MVNTDEFFTEKSDQSQAKINIITKYFEAWANVLISNSNNKVGYIDVFCGPGIYEDGSKSTPILIIEKILNNEKLYNNIQLFFNDGNIDNIEKLKLNIEKINGIEKLKYKPLYFNVELNKDIRINNLNYPCLLFIDPFGYKGLTLNLINSVLKTWGSECVFFFNYNRINMGITNDYIEEHLINIFGQNQFDILKKEISNLSAYHRELFIIETLSNSLKQKYGKYILPFKFRNKYGTRTTHHLIFVTKNIKGYEIMKDIMYKESTLKNDGIASFEYNIADIKYPTLFNFNMPLNDLSNELLDKFKGQSLNIRDIFNEHHVGTPFIARNYKDSVIKLYNEGKIKINIDNQKKKDYYI